VKKLTALYLLGISLFFSAYTASAQLRLPGLSNSDVRQALEKVINDYPSEFATLKGEVLYTNPQTIEYESLLQFKSAEKNSIVQYSGKTPVYSWQAQMFTTEEFSEAEKKYKSLYKDLKAINLTLNRDYSYRLEGDYGAPSESLKFASSVFRLLPNASNLPKVKVELSLQYELMEWKIYLSVYQKEREDDERGKVKE
jgi:hypothetical protein